MRTGFQARSKDQEEGLRWSCTLKLAQKKSWAGRWSWAAKVGLFFASSCSSTAVQRTLSLWLCPARLLKQQLRSALVAAQWRGDTALTLPLFWRRSTVSPVFFGRYLRSSFHSSPTPPVPIPNKPSRFCGLKAKCTHTRTHTDATGRQSNDAVQQAKDS